MSSKNGTLYLVAAVLALVALAFGVWDVWIRRDASGDLLREVILPGVALVLMLFAYSRVKDRPPAV